MNLRRKYLLAGAIALLPTTSFTMELKLPHGALQTVEKVQDFASYPLPIGGWKNGDFESVWTEGVFVQRAFRIDASDLTTLQLVDLLREQLIESEYDIVFECDAAACGGFDFRFDTEVLAEPDMHVDLGDFRFLSAQRMGPEKPEYLSLMVSRSSTSGYIQISHVTPPNTKLKPLTTSTKGTVADDTTNPGDLANLLESNGSFILDDLEFATGSSSLASEEFASIAALSDYLNNNPQRKIALVGHTDSEGSLSGNVALSKRRAGSVAALLTGKYGVSKVQVAAEGMGFLSPRASNLTEEGRSINRRVEVIITSTQ